MKACAVDQVKHKNRELASEILWLRILIILLILLNIVLFLKAEFPIWILLFD